MTHTFALQPSLELIARRCVDCNRYFGTERSIEWTCGSCQRDRSDRLHGQIDQLQRTIAALRGALKRKAKR